MKTAGKNFLKGLKGLALTGKGLLSITKLLFFFFASHDFSGKVTRSRTDDQISSFNSQNSEARSDFKIPYSASNDEIVDRSPDSSNFQKGQLTNESQFFFPVCVKLPFFSDETSDEILEKYRQPPHSSARFIVGSDSVNSSNVAVVKVANDHRVGSPPTIGVDMVNPVVGSREETGRPYVDNSELSHSQTFLDAKRKLRLVLSSVDVQTLPNMTVFDAATFPGSQSGQRSSKSLELLNLLKILLAEAINGQDKTKTAQIRETMRCISAFDQKRFVPTLKVSAHMLIGTLFLSLRKLMRALRDDHKKRVAYLNYLSQSKLNLLRAKSFFDRLLHRVER